MKIFASAIALGILLDATIIRAMLVPAAVAVIGQWNWLLPTWCAKTPPRRALADPAPVNAERPQGARPLRKKRDEGPTSPPHLN